jgi:hypothetical protein
MNKNLLIAVGLIIIGVFIFLFIVNNKNIEVNSFESCVDAGYRVVESYPRQCRTPDGRNFVEGIIEDWERDGIILMENKKTGEYACFGCNNVLCVDPAPTMQFVAETERRYCSNEFEVIDKKLIRECPDEWIADRMPCVCGPEDNCELCKNREYFIVDGERKDVKDYDVAWIEENCDEIERRFVY